MPVGPGTEFHPEPTADADGSGQAYVTGLAPFEDVDDGTTRLVSPISDAGTAADLMIS